MEQVVGATRRERLWSFGCEHTNVRFVSQVNPGEASGEDHPLSSSSSREPGVQLLPDVGSQHRLDRDKVVKAMRMEGGEAVSQGSVQQPSIMPEQGMGAVPNLHLRQGSVTWQFRSDQLSEILPPSQIISRFGFSRCIDFAMHLNMYYV